jgi:3-oxoacyl-[acyl-carrier-protein] synthase II
MWIKSFSTISHQPTFRNNGFSAGITELESTSKLITPDYSAFIPAMERRRMSDVLKMSIACSIDCLEKSGIDKPDAVIVGTAMGCSIHTKNFLEKIASSNGELISPTSFIVSTHNTIAGQISLLLKTHGYNMTHTQNSLSFEQGLIDAEICLNTECKNVLVGGADEEEYTIYNMYARLNNTKLHLTSGASFFVLSNENENSDCIKIADVETFGLINDPSEIFKDFLETNSLTTDDIDIVLYANTEEKRTDELKKLFGEDKIMDYQEITGTYFTNSAFAMHIGIDMMSLKDNDISTKKLKHVLICNNLISENLGLILLKK